MGITFSYRRLPQSEAQEILAGNLALFSKWFGPENIDEYDDWFEWLRGSEQYLDIFKSWQAIHFLLTDEVCVQGESKFEGPLRNVVMGGTPTNIETIYGVYYYLTPVEVAEVAAALKPLTAEVVSLLYNAAAFRQANIYPSRERWNDEEAGKRLAFSYYNLLREFFLAAARENQAMFLTAD